MQRWKEVEDDAEDDGRSTECLEKPYDRLSAVSDSLEDVQIEIVKTKDPNSARERQFPGYFRSLDNPV